MSPSSQANVRSRQTIQSVARASRILMAVTRSPEGLTASEVSAEIGLSISTAYHLLATLEEEGLLSKDPGKRYGLGPAAVTIANSRGLRPRISRQHRRALRYLADATRETAYLTAWFRDEIRILATVEGSQAVRVAGLEVGNTRDVHARASAKLLLAFADEDRRNLVLDGHVYTAFTPKTVRDRATLERDMDEIRRTGIVYDGGEYFDGVRSLSAPVRSNGEVVAALAVLAPAERYSLTEAELLAALRDAVAVAERPEEKPPSGVS